MINNITKCCVTLLLLHASILSAQTLKGRYVRLSHDSSKILSVAEVEVLSRGKNVALDKKATSSSEKHGGNPERAVDGNTDQSWAGKSITHTDESDPKPTLEIDLGKEYNISSIKVYNREDCCSDRLDGVRISILGSGRALAGEYVIKKAEKVHDIAASSFDTSSKGKEIKKTGKMSKKEAWQKAKKQFPQYYASDEEMKWWEDAQFGVFMHWGPCSIAKTEISWGRNGPRGRSKNKANGGVPEEEYNNLYKSFNPEKFNADEWAKMIKESGAKYFVFTTKHHDGFCMFDASNTDFKITKSPFKRDIVKELAAACQKHGIKIFWYYSQPDWTHKDYPDNINAYREYMYEHIRTLLTKYGKIDGMWFDSLGSQWKDWKTGELVKIMKELQPGLIINTRWGYGGPVPFNGDYDTPEQNIGSFQTHRPWETCATMGPGWSWRGGHSVKSKRTCLRMLIQCTGSGGNLLLNVGPSDEGIINPPEVENYLFMGKWLKKYGKSIYGTSGGPYMPGPWGVSAYKGNKVYLHVLSAFASEDYQQLKLPVLPAKLTGIKTLTGQSVKPTKKGDMMILTLSGTPDPLDTIIELTYDKDVSDIEPVDTRDGLIKGHTVSCSSERKHNPVSALAEKKGKGQFHAGIHHKKYWAPQYGKTTGWVEYSYEKPIVFTRIELAEPLRATWTREFSIEYEKNGKWVTLYEGKEISIDFSLITKPIKTKKVRVNILKTADDQKHAGGIQDFNIYK
jgi:alpha-L-fucosidase